MRKVSFPVYAMINLSLLTLSILFKNFRLDVLIEVRDSISLPIPKEIVKDVAEAVKEWSMFAKMARGNQKRISEITGYHRLNL